MMDSHNYGCLIPIAADEYTAHVNLPQVSVIFSLIIEYYNATDTPYTSELDLIATDGT